MSKQYNSIYEGDQYKQIEDVPEPFLKLNFGVNIIQHRFNGKYLYVNLGKIRKLYTINMKSTDRKNLVVEITTESMKMIKSAIMIEFIDDFA